MIFYKLNWMMTMKIDDHNIKKRHFFFFFKKEYIHTYPSYVGPGLSLSQAWAVLEGLSSTSPKPEPFKAGLCKSLYPTFAIC
jgi:hypothetical protein